MKWCKRWVPILGYILICLGGVFYGFIRHYQISILLYWILFVLLGVVFGMVFSKSLDDLFKDREDK